MNALNHQKVFTLVATKSSLNKFSKRLRSHQRSLKSSGFTLVEIMIVVAIIALIASIGLPNLQRVNIKAQQGRAIADFRAIFNAAEMYQANTGVYPTRIISLTGTTPPYINREVFEKYGWDGVSDALNETPYDGVCFSYEAFANAPPSGGGYYIAIDTTNVYSTTLSCSGGRGRIAVFQGYSGQLDINEDYLL